MKEIKITNASFFLGEQKIHMSCPIGPRFKYQLKKNLICINLNEIDASSEAGRFVNRNACPSPPTTFATWVEERESGKLGMESERSLLQRGGSCHSNVHFAFISLCRESRRLKALTKLMRERERTRMPLTSPSRMSYHGEGASLQCQVANGAAILFFIDY